MEAPTSLWPVWRFDSGYAELARYVAPEAITLDFDFRAPLTADEESGKSPAELDRIRAERLYAQLAERRVRYEDDPWASREGVQQIRHPWWLFHDKLGNCLDISLAYAGLCLASRVGVLLALTKTHAFVVLTPGRLHVGGSRAGVFEVPGFEPARLKGDTVDRGVMAGTGAALQAARASSGLRTVDAIGVNAEGFDFAAATESAAWRDDEKDGDPGEESVWLVDVPHLQTEDHRKEWPHPVSFRPSIRQRVPSGGEFREFSAHADVIAALAEAEGVHLLIGESGRGKSMLARHLAEGVEDGAAWFLDASDRKALLNSLAMAMHAEMGRPEGELQEAERKALAETAITRLRAAAGSWLVVLDNADGDPESIRDLLPVPKDGQRVLITSTNEQWLTFLAAGSISDWQAHSLPPVDLDQVDGPGKGVADLVEGRPLLIDAFSRLGADGRTAEGPPPVPEDLPPALRGPAAYWALLRALPEFGEAELEVAALAAFLPPNGQPVAALTSLVREGGPAVEFLVERGLLGIDRNLGLVRMHRLFGAAVRADLEAGDPDLCTEMVRLLSADENARAALDEYGDLATVARLDDWLTKVDKQTSQADRDLGLALHGVATLLELHGHTRRSGLTFERAERHLVDDPSLRADCLIGRGRTINQHHKKEQEKLEEAIGWAREARELKLAAEAEGPAYRALAMEGLLRRPLANFGVAGKTRKEMLDEAQAIIEEADDHRQRLSDREVPPAEKARSRYNLAGVRIPKAQESPARAAEHLGVAESIYSEVAEKRSEIYGRMVHPHIAACVNGLAVAAYYRAMLLPVDAAERSALLRKATAHATEALLQREVLDGSVDGDEATKSAALLAKIALARSASPPAKGLEDAEGVAAEAIAELQRSDRLPPPVPSLPPGRRGLLEGIDRWARSEALWEVVAAFGEIPPGDLELPALLEWLDRFSERWDFRKGERDIGTGVRLPARTARVVESSAAALGLAMRGVDPSGRYDCVLILGGLARACLSRPLYTARLLARDDVEADRVVAIGAFRSLSDGERDLLKTVAAASADDEFAAMSLGVRSAFGVEDPVSRTGERQENPYASWELHEYRAADGTALQVAAAPSSEPELRRANTADTLTWLVDTQLELREGQRLLIVTTDIYVPFQHADALRSLALPHGVEVEVAGVVPGLVDHRLAHEFTPDKYLQEIRSTIRSLRRLYETLAAPSG